MKYPIHTSAIIDVTKPPYCADNTGKTDCTETLVRILDELLYHNIPAREAFSALLIRPRKAESEDAGWL